MDKPAPGATLHQISMPAGWTLVALVVGLALGWLLAGNAAGDDLLLVAGPIGKVWLNALQMTIIPLVASLLVVGIAKMILTARAGTMARRTLIAFVSVLAGGSVLACLLMPALLQMFPVPASAQATLVSGVGDAGPVPGIGAFFESLVAPNVIAAAAETAMLPLIVFFAAFGIAITRLPGEQYRTLLGLFEALGNAMLVIIGWVLWVAPLGVFALAIGVGLRSGGGAFAALGHYILLVSSLGVAILIAAYVIAVVAARRSPFEFARAVLPSQTVALSTQSSLASLPAMLGSCRRLGVRETTADFVLPLAVAIFRATSPAMNIAVAIYVAKLTGTELTPLAIAAGGAVALATTVGSVSLPGAVSFVTSIGPIAIAMGVPVEPLALLVAVEMLPDIVRTVGNVTMNVAVTAMLDRGADDEN